MGRAGGKAYSEALKKHQSESSTTAQPAKDPKSGSPVTSTGKVVGRFDMKAGQGYINNKPVSLEEYQAFSNMKFR